MFTAVGISRNSFSTTHLSRCKMALEMPPARLRAKDDRHPLVDILLPVRNGAPFLAQAIESIQAQTVTSWRLLVLDDGSTDRTAQIAKRYAAQDGRIRVVQYPARGLIDTLNAGLKLCRAPFVARQDADDISFPDRLACEIEYFEQHPECIAVSGGGITINEAGKPQGGAWFNNPEWADPFWIPAREPYLSHPFLMVRRKILQRLRYRNFFICEDADLCWRLEEAGKIHSIRKPFGYYRVSNKSVSTRRAVDTRIQAIASQLAAIAAQRRRTKRGDIHPERQLYEKMVKANRFEAILELFRDKLSASEFEYLRVASIIKFIEIATYRLSKVSPREALLAYRELRAISRKNWSGRDSIYYYCRRAHIHLLLRGNYQAARKLAPGIRGWLIVAFRQSWLLPLLPKQ
jgi:glycosyltransferase involved in cell wall biosynthesis